MSKKNKLNNLSELVQKYSSYSVAEEIEHNLLSSQRCPIEATKLVLPDLFEEENYYLDLYESLSDSIQKDGFLVPLIVAKREDGQYEILNGVKRFLIGKRLGMKEMPCVKAELEKTRKMTYMIENIMAEHDHPLVKSKAFLVLEEKYGYRDVDIAQITHLSITQVRNLKRLSSLPDFLKEEIRKGRLDYTKARTLLNLSSKQQIELYEKMSQDHLSVREIEKEKRDLSGVKRKTKLVLRGKTITIRFASEEEANKLYQKLKTEVI